MDVKIDLRKVLNEVIKMDMGLWGAFRVHMLLIKANNKSDIEGPSDLAGERVLNLG